MRLTTLERAIVNIVLLLAFGSGSSMGQDVPQSLAPVPTAVFRLSPELDKYPIRDIEWFAKLPSAGAAFVRRDLPLGSFTLVMLNEMFEILTEVKLALPWKKNSRELRWCCLSPDLFVVIRDDWTEAGLCNSDYALYNPKSGELLKLGTIDGIWIDSLRPVWKKGVIVMAISHERERTRASLRRFDKEMNEVWSVDNPLGENKRYASTPIVHLLDKRSVGVLNENSKKLVRFLIKDGSRTETPLTTDAMNLKLVDGDGLYAPLLTGHPGELELHYFDSTGALVHRRQVSVPLDTRGPISANHVYSDTRGNVWLSDRQSIFQIDAGGDARKRAGTDPERPLLVEIGPMTVNRFGELICQDVLSGALFHYDRDGNLIHSEPTSSIDFPTVSNDALRWTIEVCGNRDILVPPPMHVTGYIRYAADLTKKEHVNSKFRILSVHERTSTFCESDFALECFVRPPGEKVSSVLVRFAEGGKFMALRLLDNNSIAALVWHPESGTTLVCQSLDGACWFQSVPSMTNRWFQLCAGVRWVCASSLSGECIVVDTVSKKSIELQLDAGETIHGHLRYFIDTSQPTGEELVEIDCLTRVVRRFPLPNLDAASESKPAVK